MNLTIRGMVPAVGLLLLISTTTAQSSLFNSFPASRNTFRGQLRTSTVRPTTSLFGAPFREMDNLFGNPTTLRGIPSIQPLITDRPSSPPTTTRAPITTTRAPTTTTTQANGRKKNRRRGRRPRRNRQRPRSRRPRIQTTAPQTPPPTRSPTTTAAPTTPQVEQTTPRQPSLAPHPPSLAPRPPSLAPRPPSFAPRPPSFAPPQPQVTTPRNPFESNQNFLLPHDFPTINVVSHLNRPPPPRPTPNQGNQNLPTPQKIAEIRAEATQFILTDEEWIPNLVQLVFHTCVGGCDGCVNFQEKDNRGLVDTYATVRERWANTEGRLLSLADFVVLMGTEAAQIGLFRSLEPRTSDPLVAFFPGRTTCPDPDNYNLHHIFPQGDTTDGVGFLMNEFGYEDRSLAVALLGAHSLGRCRPENSGFDGRWDNTPLVLDNHYYKSLTETDMWTAVPMSGSFQWNSSDVDGPMMLHADMALLHSFDVDANKRPSCGVSTRCNRSKDSGKVNIYSHSFQVWVRDFIPAFLQMVDKRPAGQT